MAVVPQWQSIKPNFSGSNQAMANAQRGIDSSTSTIGSILDRERALKQQAIQNQMAEASLLLQQAAGQRDADKYNRDVAGDEALRTYTQQLSNVGGSLPTTDADKLLQLYNKGGDVQSSYDAMIAPSKIEEMQTLTMPSGEYDPTKLLAMQEKAVAKPQSTLDAIVSERAKEQVRQQGLKDRMNLAMFKESIKTVKPAAKEAEYNRLLKDGMDSTEARLLVWGDKSGSSDKSGKTFSLDPKATDIDLDFFGSGDTQKAIDIGQKLQDSFGLKTPEVTALLQQSIGGFLDKSLETDKLAKALKSSGLVKTSYYKDVKTGDIKPMDGVMMAEALQNPDIVIRTNEDGSRVFIDEGKEREKLRKLNEFNRPVATTPIQNVDNKTTSPLGYYPELMP